MKISRIRTQNLPALPGSQSEGLRAAGHDGGPLLLLLEALTTPPPLPHRFPGTPWMPLDASLWPATPAAGARASGRPPHTAPRLGGPASPVIAWPTSTPISGGRRAGETQNNPPANS